MQTEALITYLKGLRANNEKAWFETHRAEYDQLRKEFLTLTTDTLAQASAFEPNLDLLDPKRTLFRINRDVRFSANKAPYKTQFSSMFRIGLREDLHAGYYFHIDADGMLVAGAGIFGLQPDVLEHSRKYIAEHHEQLADILATAKGAGYDDLDGEALKKVPRAFPADHPAGEYLKFKYYILSHSEEALLASSPLSSHIAHTLHDAQPFLQFIAKAIAIA